MLPLRVLLACVTLLLVMPFAAHAQQSDDGAAQPQMPGSQVETYKQVGDVELKMYIFTPQDHKPSDRRPAAVFFFGGGWRSGSPQQFLNQCRYLAERGMVAMAADYRVASRHGTKAVACVADAKSAVRWVRQHAQRLGIDPDRILAGGGSAGGHLAACTGVLEGFDESSEDATVSSRPNALALFNPALVLGNVDGREPLNPQRVGDLQERMGVEPRELSPLHHVRPGAPPTIVFHGKADTTVLYWTAEAFTQAMQQAGNRCELIGYEDQPHGFFNHGRGENRYYTQTLRALDQFLASLGYLTGPPTLDD